MYKPQHVMAPSPRKHPIFMMRSLKSLTTRCHIQKHLLSIYYLEFYELYMYC